MLHVTQLIGFATNAVNDPFFIEGTSVDLTTASSSANPITWSHTTTPETTCLVVGGAAVNNSNTIDINNVLFNSLPLNFITGGSSGNSSRLFYMLNPPVGTYAVYMQADATNDRFLGGYALNLGNVREVNASNFAESTTAETLSVNLTTTKRSIIVASQLVGSTNIIIPTIELTAPVGSVAATTTSNQSNNFGKRATLSYSPLVDPGTVTVTGLSQFIVAYHKLTAAAFSNS